MHDLSLRFYPALCGIRYTDENAEDEQADAVLPQFESIEKNDES